MDAKSETESDVEPDSDKWFAPPLLLAFLAVTFVFHFYRLIGYPWILAYMVFAYSNLLLLFWCLDRLYKALADSQRRRALEVAVWVLMSTYIVTFFLLATSIMPLALKILMWSMAGATFSFITYVFLLPHDNSGVAVGRKAVKL